MALYLDRLDGERLVLDGHGIAQGFFVGDPSSIAEGSYDSLAGKGKRDQISLADITAINRTMRARSGHKHWAAFVDRDLPWLAAIDPHLDLIEADDEQWRAARGDDLAAEALAAAVGPFRGPSVATKVLHLKRPRFFPVLDDFVAVMLGVNMPDGAAPTRRAEVAWKLMEHLRRQGHANRAELQDIQCQLHSEGIDRPLVRILDAIIWFSHPAAGVPGTHREMAVRVV